ncbi:MAG: hypothetical protein QM538_07260 [Methylacidiphilales bacterium]|nr:hypothetical protein [Candidatus Methylacidiphilales bacterium]
MIGIITIHKNCFSDNARNYTPMIVVLAIEHPSIHWKKIFGYMHITKGSHLVNRIIKSLRKRNKFVIVTLPLSLRLPKTNQTVIYPSYSPLWHHYRKGNHGGSLTSQILPHLSNHVKTTTQVRSEYTYLITRVVLILLILVFVIATYLFNKNDNKYQPVSIHKNYQVNQFQIISVLFNTLNTIPHYQLHTITIIQALSQVSIDVTISNPEDKVLFISTLAHQCGCEIDHSHNNYLLTLPKTTQRHHGASNHIATVITTDSNQVTSIINQHTCFVPYLTIAFLPAHDWITVESLHETCN